MPQQRATVRARTRPSQRRGGRECARSDAGFTLIELLIAAALSIVVLGAITSVLISSQNVQARDNEWSQMISEARSSLALMTGELRQAYSIRETGGGLTEKGGARIKFYATIGGNNYEVEYDCTVDEPGTAYKECVRRQAPFTGSAAPTPEELASATAVPIIKHVLNGTPADEPEGKEDPIFQEFSPNAITPDLITIRLVVPAGGTLKLAGAAVYQHHVILSDAAYIPNMALGA